jgi:hypothetical protein
MDGTRGESQPRNTADAMVIATNFMAQRLSHGLHMNRVMVAPPETWEMVVTPRNRAVWARAGTGRLTPVRNLYSNFGQPLLRWGARSQEATHCERFCEKWPSGRRDQVVANSVPDTQPDIFKRLMRRCRR